MCLCVSVCVHECVCVDIAMCVWEITVATYLLSYYSIPGIFQLLFSLILTTTAQGRYSNYPHFR